MKPLQPLVAALLLLAPVARAAERLPDFSAAVSAAHSQLKASFTPVTASQQEKETLRELMKDRDPQVRQAAVRAFKSYVTQSRADYELVLDMLKSYSETKEVKIQCVKTLSFVAHYNDVSDALLSVAKSYNADKDLRAIAYKSLYWQAAQQNSVRDELLSVAKGYGDADLRRAAIWGLFLSVNDNSTREALLDIVKRGNDGALRVEALRSLYGSMNYNDTRDAVMELAKRSYDKPLRRAAILALSARNNNDGRDILTEIAHRETDPELRQAAITALGDPFSEELTRFFHILRRGQNGGLVNDPLDAE